MTSCASPSISSSSRPGHVGLDRMAAAARLALDDVAEERLVVVDRQQRADRGGDDGEHERDRDRRAQRVDVQAGVERGHQQDHAAVEHERAEPEREHRDRQQQPDRQRPQQRVDERDQRGRRRARPRRPRRRRPRTRRRESPSAAAVTIQTTVTRSSTRRGRRRVGMARLCQAAPCGAIMRARVPCGGARHIERTRRMPDDRRRPVSQRKEPAWPRRLRRGACLLARLGGVSRPRAAAGCCSRGS